ncbi:MAG: DUF3817 domain-containing protein [Verrucomicrobiota bacterium]
MSTFLTLRYTAIAEGVSYLILLFIAMPLKYGMGVEIAVRVVGMAHGILFLALCAALLYALWKSVISFPMSILVFVASLIPFGAFWADHRLREEQRSI